MSEGNIYLSSLIAGAVAGLTVDVALFPLDTIKTRLQAAQGFIKAGGFNGVYKGIGPQAIGSGPSAGLFFCTYESFKSFATPRIAPQYAPVVHMAGASLGCMYYAIRTEGIRKGLYRGFGSTVLREIPFSFIQFPIYEQLKILCSKYFVDGGRIPSYQVSICGAIAGGIAAAATCPLDVAKTRIMLADSKVAATLNIRTVLKLVYTEKGLPGLFAGFVPRVLWITIGGAIFFGAYDITKNMTNPVLLPEKTT